MPRSPETSRENSYERDDGMGHGHHHHHHQYQLSQPQSMDQHHLSPGTRRRHQQVRIKVDASNFNLHDLIFFRGIHQMQMI